MFYQKIRQTILGVVFMLGFSSIVMAEDLVVNINTGTVEELAELDGIGPKKAKAIVLYREKNGYFNSADDLDAIKGIGPKTIDGFRDQVELDVPLDHELKKKGYK